MIAITKRKIAFAVSCLGFAAVLVAGVKEHAATRNEAEPAVAAAGATLHPVIVAPGPETPRVLTTQTNHAGEVALASCSSCHTTTTPNRNVASAEQLLKFHQGITYAHGNQSCLSCHNETDYDSLRLANGSSLPYSDVMKLCGQCHGPQLRDYEMGLHGGMNGYWDRTRGPRTRNNCIQCHDPHNPAYPVVQPVLPPKDRIAVPKGKGHATLFLYDDGAERQVCPTYNGRAALPRSPILRCDQRSRAPLHHERISA